MAASPPEWTTMPSTGTSTDRRTLLFRGTFDPVHYGHLYIISKAIELTDYERIVVMPAAISNFKPGTHPAGGADRLAMLSLALEHVDARGREIVLSSYEIDKSGVSYTYDTVCEMYRRFGIAGRLGFLMGDDLLADPSRRYRHDDLCALVDFVCFTRDGVNLDCPEGAAVRFFSVEPFHASSTDVRSGDMTGLPPEVARYIEEHGLYHAGRNRQGD